MSANALPWARSSGVLRFAENNRAANAPRVITARPLALNSPTAVVRVSRKTVRGSKPSNAGVTCRVSTGVGTGTPKSPPGLASTALDSSVPGALGITADTLGWASVPPIADSTPMGCPAAVNSCSVARLAAKSALKALKSTPPVIVSAWGGIASVLLESTTLGLGLKGC